MTRTCIAVGLVLLASTASAQTRSVYTEDLTWFEIRDAIAAGTTTAIIYAGGTEQNGPHMALAKHNVIAHYVAGEAAKRLGNALVYPVMPFSPAGDVGGRTGHMRFPGTVSLSPEVFLGVMRQVAQSAVAAGFTEVYLMGEHGQGLAEIRLAAESVDADARARGVRVRYVEDVQTKAGQQVNAYLKARGIVGGGHAAVAETAQIMFLDAQKSLIRPDQIAVSAAGPEPSTGVGGNPSAATAEMGRELLEYKIAAAVDRIRALAAEK